MKKMKTWLKYNRITGLFLVFGTLSVLAVAFLLYSSLTNLIIKTSVNSTENSVNQTGKYLEEYIRHLKTICNTVVMDPDVVEYFGNSGSQSEDFYKSRIQTLIDNQVHGDGTLDTIVLISKDGRLFSNASNLDMSMSKDMMQEDWYVKAIQNDMPILTSARMQAFSMNKNNWVISLSQEIVNAEGENIGVAVLDVPYTSIESYLAELSLGKKGFAFILNSENNVVFHPDPSYFQDAAKKQELVNLMKRSPGYQRGENWLINQYQIANSDWTLVSVSSVDTLAILRRQVFESVVFGIAVILVVVVIASVILKRLTEQIKKQADQVHKYELEGLYGQINPHFLYNTLDTIVWMAEFDQKEQVISTTKSLAQFFRLSLNQGRSETTIGGEIDHIKQYLYIQKQRYQEKLSYEFEIEDPILLDYPVPKIILQPIVENAIYHGIKDKDGDGHIQISVRHGDTSGKKLTEVLIVIADDGTGMDLREQVLPASTKIKLGGVGLVNVDSRIRLFGGEKNSLEIHSEKEEGTRVTIRLWYKK